MKGHSTAVQGRSVSVLVFGGCSTNRMIKTCLYANKHTYTHTYTLGHVDEIGFPCCAASACQTYSAVAHIHTRTHTCMHTHTHVNHQPCR
jgi:hypothetical protein